MILIPPIQRSSPPPISNVIIPKTSDNAVKTMSLEKYFAICNIRPDIGRFEEPDENEGRYESVRSIFDKLCSIRKPRPLNENDLDLKILYKTSPSELTTQAKSTIAVGLSPELRAKIVVTIQKDFANVPPKFLQFIGKYLDLKTLLDCRLVCLKWNVNLTTSPSFLERTVFRVSQSLDLVERCNTKVKWRHIKTSFFPCENQIACGYHQKYLVSKLRQDAIKNLRMGGQFFPLLSRVSSLVLTNVDLNKDTFLKWLNSSGVLLRSLEFHSCTLKRSKIMWHNKTVDKRSWGLSSMKASNMTLTSLVEFERLVVLVGKSLRVLEIGVRQVHEIESARRSKLEIDLCSLLFEIVGVHGKTLQSLEITLLQFLALDGLPRLFGKLGSSNLPKLENFGFKVMKGPENKDVMETGFLGEARVPEVMAKLSKNGRNKLKRIHVPFWSCQDPHNPEPVSSSIFRMFPNLTELGARFRLSSGTSIEENIFFDGIEIEDLEYLQKSRSIDATNENYISPLISKILGQEIPRLLTKLIVYGTFFAAHIKRCFPMVTELEIHGIVTSTEFQGIIRSFPKLEKLCVLNVKAFEDITLMGKEPPLMQILKEKSLARKNKDKEFGEKYPLSRIQSNLRILRIRGEMEITDVGIIHSFNGLTNLEVLELSGSPLNVSTTGLKFIARNCPQLRQVVMDLSKDTTNEAGVAEFLENLPFLQGQDGGGKISVI